MCLHGTPYFKYCPFHLYHYKIDVPTRQTVRKCTFFAIMGIVIKSSIKIHLGCSLQKQTKFSIKLIVLTTMISDIIVKNIIIKICFYLLYRQWWIKGGWFRVNDKEITFIRNKIKSNAFQQTSKHSLRQAWRPEISNMNLEFLWR